MRRAVLPLILLLAACKPDPETDAVVDADADTDADADSDADSDADTDSDADADTEPAPGWTKGPALPACTPSTGDPTRVALSGVVLLPQGAVAVVVVVDRDAGTIECAGESCDTTGATVVCTDGIVSPALLDTHDHTQYNVLAPWRHDELYEDRYDWQSDGDYYDYREAYDAMADTYGCEIVKWAELRQIVGGATSVVGSTDGSCVDVLARNLDEPEAHGLDGYSLEFSSSRVEYLDDADGQDRADELASGQTEVFLDHVAEGVGGSVRGEIDHMFDIGASGPGNVFVHATDADTSQLARMAATGTGIVWSPRSNLDLYAETTQADLAIKLGVPVALGPDWTWSGSNRVTQELSCAREWLAARASPVTDQDLWELATLDASVLLELQGRLGVLEAGAEADLSVFAFRDEPYRAVIEAAYEDVRLVMIDGDARYGVPALVSGLEANPAWCESVTACTAERTLCVAEAASGDDGATFADLEAVLSSALEATSMPPDLAYAGELYPLWACDEQRPSCDPREPAAGDVDGDGVGDGSDDCPNAYDPAQQDQDGDGRGDPCDPCVLSPEPTCEQSPDDLDDDGIPNEGDGCPWVHDPGNPDADDDGKPDACDACPDVSNPGAGGCPTTIPAIRDPSHPDHPEEGASVSVVGVVTGAGVSSFFLQDPDADEYAALYVFGRTATVGQRVTVSGTYVEYFGLTELEDVTVSGAAPAPVPDALVVDPCDVGTGGPDGERYESMLVAVEDVTVTDPNPDAPGDFNEFEVAGCLRVDDLLCPTCWVDQPANGTSWSRLTAPLTWSFGNTKLVPRTPADLEP